MLEEELKARLLKMLVDLTNDQIKYSDWKCYYNIFVELINKNNNEIDYVAISYALLKIDVEFSNLEEEKDYEQETENLRKFCEYLKEIQNKNFDEQSSPMNEIFINITSSDSKRHKITEVKHYEDYIKIDNIAAKICEIVIAISITGAIYFQKISNSVWDIEAIMSYVCMFCGLDFLYDLIAFGSEKAIHATKVDELTDSFFEESEKESEENQQTLSRTKNEFEY